MVWGGGALENGYGRIYALGLPWKVHRLAWTLLRGPIPAGMTVDHLCHNRACIEPSHLRITTPVLNSKNRPHIDLGVPGAFVIVQ